MNLSKINFKSIESAELEFLKRLAVNDPGSPALLILSRVYLDQNQPELCTEITQGVLNAHPNHIEAVSYTHLTLPTN